ncbi:YtxH domain-containing protein [uncultured Aquimarina sp.]|uniref:YtxH domain-containing protein n=1 Tax=uncultured Aquimarina sp. TaxID=575652 RepID=UPI0026357753|nr:YtxH domain-containing protein [uncultured Aquimarina sp.]
MSSNSNTIIGLATGAALGAVTALLFAPDNGKNTRKKIKVKVKDTKEDLVERANIISNEITSKFNSEKAEFSKEIDGLVNDMSLKADDVIVTLEKKLEMLRKRNEKINAN